MYYCKTCSAVIRKTILTGTLEAFVRDGTLMRRKKTRREERRWGGNEDLLCRENGCEWSPSVVLKEVRA